MALFRFKWLRKFIRRRTAPMSYDVATRGKHRLSLLYAFFAWNAFGLVLYQVYRGKMDWAVHHGLPKDDITPAQRYAKMLGMEKAKVIRFGNLGMEEYDIASGGGEDDLSENIVELE